jgi:hypothetical protein
MAANNFVPANATVEELEKKAADCEQRAAQLNDATDTTLQKEAELYRSWIVVLRSGQWTA